MQARRALILGFIVLFGAAYLGLRHFSAAYVDLVWFRHLGYAAIFWRVVTARIYTGVVGGLLFGLFLYVNLRVLVPGLRHARLEFMPSPYSVFLRPARARSAAVWISVLVAVLAGWILASQWSTVSFFLHAVPFAQTDPIFHRNAAFYVFRLPFYRLLYATAGAAFWLTGIAVLLVYLAAGLVNFVDGRLVVHPRARAHLSLITAGYLVLKAIGYRLDAWNLLVSPDRGFTFGPGYADVHAALPVLRGLMVAALAAAAGAAAAATGRGRGRLLPWGIGGLALLSIVFGSVYPSLVEGLVVRPDQLARERPYISDNIQATRAAFDLGGIKLSNFPVQQNLTAKDLTTFRATFRNIRLWDQDIANPAFQELQGLRTYYTIDNLSVGRYTIDGHYRLVLLGAREINYENLPSNTWVNEHLKFTHGYGAVVLPASQVAAQGLPLFWMKNIADTSNVGLKLAQPRIYYGEQTVPYAIVGPRSREFDYPNGQQDVYNHYTGRGGIPVGTFLQRLTFSIWAGDYNTLLSAAVGPGSKALIYRSLDQRLPELLNAPFLSYDSQPYLAIANGKLYWIVDAYTTSSNYPYSTPSSTGLNYIRNAVKVVVNAYSGSVTFYVADPQDPIIRAEEGIFPGVFRPLSAMPPALHRQIRYPIDYFSIQASMYAKYHMTDPTVFYNDEDQWNIAQEVQGSVASTLSTAAAPAAPAGSGTFSGAAAAPAPAPDALTTPVLPYYVILKLAGMAHPQFVLMEPFTPIGQGRDNMAAWMAAFSDGSNYGKVVAYEFPKEQTVFGPLQVDSQIDQDPNVAQLLTLWSQGGSEVYRGNLLVIPIRHAMLYVEPLYQEAQSTNLPALRRVIVDYGGQQIAMGDTLDQALAQIFGPLPWVQGTTTQAAVGTPAAASGTPAQAAKPGTGAALTLLAQQAATLYASAQSDLRSGNFAGYAKEIQALGAVITRMRAAAAGAPSPATATGGRSSG